MVSNSLDSQALPARTQRAIAAATKAAGELGIRVEQPRVLHDVFSVIVRLDPAPVVARIPLVLPPDLNGPAQLARQQRELDVVNWLVRRAIPVVRPSPLVPSTPVAREGLSMTFWELVELEMTGVPDYVAQAGEVPKLHAALRGYPGELPFLAPVSHTVPGCLKFLSEHRELIDAADLERARAQWSALEPMLRSAQAFCAAFPQARVQPIHGDAPAYNMIRTTSGVRHADFEDVTLGPPEWDLTLLGPEMCQAHDEAAQKLGLPPHDPAVLQVMNHARMLQVVACHALVPQLPMLAQGLAPSLEQWRKASFAIG